ncbi:uroporphyrinogen decarboxylase family protein [Candidatus Sumerlaeota bacterium]
MSPRIPCSKPDPDFNRLLQVLKREGVPDRVPFYELFSNIQDDVLRAIGKPPDDDPANWLRNHVEYMLSLGYDYINAGGDGFWFPTKERAKGMTAEGQVGYVQGGDHTIASREEFEKYAWPVMSEIDYSPLETAVPAQLPEGMKVISASSGMLENVMWLLGYEGICQLIYDDEQLVIDMFEAVGTRIITYLETCASFDTVGAIVMGEDMGFKTQTFLSPEMYRKYLFPWHKRLVQAIHRLNKPIILHACGNLSAIMEDIIDCGWDARHSFEDQIEPVWEIKQQYGGRIALLGGFDMDKICRMSEEEVRAHTRLMIDKCAPGGGWALGTGNSVANYIPVANFLAMLDEGRP